MKNRWIVHPVLFAILPILGLYAHNIGQLAMGDLLVPIALAAPASALLWFLLARRLRDPVRPALIASLFWLWFFSCGHVFALAVKIPGAAWVIPTRSAFTGIYAIPLLAGIALLARCGRNWRPATMILNLVAIVLVAWQVVAIGGYEFKRVLARRDVARVELVNAAGVRGVGAPPNIYFIILDAYARADVLKDLYHYDNSAFLNHLERKGFFVARSGRANYPQTLLSLASCWNLEYLDGLAKQQGPQSSDRIPLQEMIADSKVGRFLKQRGYQTVAFSTGYEGTDLQLADVHLGQVDGLGQFQGTLLDTTALPAGFVSRWLFGLDEVETHRRRVLYTLEHLADPARLRPPVFVFAHIVCPHPPFLFDRRGRPVKLVGDYNLGDGPWAAGSRQAYLAGYREQLMFLNRQVEAALDRLLAVSRYPTVIILEGDHGPGSRWDLAERDPTAQRERLANLDAYYLPGGGALLSEDMSPVNIFRIVFNRYFGAHLPLLPNESYFSTWGAPYRFTRVTDAVNAKPAAPRLAQRRAARAPGDDPAARVARD